MTKYKIVGVFLLFGLVALTSMIANAVYSAASVLETIRYFLLAPLFLIIYSLTSDSKNINKILLTVILLSLSASIYSYWLIASIGIRGFILAGVTFLHGVRAGTANPNTIAMVIAYPLPLILSYLLLSKAKRLKAVAFLVLAFSLLIWLLWNSRSTYIYIFMALLVILWHCKNRKIYFGIVFGVVAVGIILTFSLPVIQDLFRVAGGLSLRDELWKAAIRIFSEHPILGAGPGSYETLKFINIDPGQGRDLLVNFSGAAAHNLLLTKAAELGIIGCLLIVYFLYLIIMYYLENKSIMRKSNYYYLYVGCYACFIGFIFRSFFELGDIIGNGRISSNIIPLLIVALIIRLPMHEMKTIDVS